MVVSKQYNEEFVSVIALKCGDVNFEDFTKLIYGQGIYEAQRKIAIKYRILERFVDIVIAETDPAEIPLYLNNFKAETRFIVNDIQFFKTQKDKLESQKYYLYFNEEGQWVFNYKGRALNDKIRIYYISHGPISEESDGNPVIPDIYYDELIRLSVLKMCEYGIARFDAKKKEKYYDIFRLHSRQDDKREDSGLLRKNTEWITMKLMEFP